MLAFVPEITRATEVETSPQIPNKWKLFVVFCLFVFFFFGDRVLHMSRAGPALIILPHLLPEFWHPGCVPPHPAPFYESVTN